MLLGEEEEKTYLVLFQNNMELRPTGGFIGSFALVTFSKGRMVDINVMDVYSADGQLKGHVEPPTPIKEYLNEANWYLRDSNWDPDFPTSADRAEWFLDKEIEKKVDGVIAVDLELVKDIVDIKGSVYLHDFDKEITAENLYEVTQYESEKDFFPGSRRKAFFLTALSQEILNLLSSGDLNKYELAKAIYSNLDERHVQIYFHDTDAQDAVSNAYWSGEVKVPECNVENCYADFIGFAEANLGVNKANFFIDRSIRVKTSVSEGLVEREASVTLKNNANSALGNEARYKAYLRAIAPKDSFFDEVEIKGAENKTIQPEIKYYNNRVEAGVITQVMPGGDNIITFKWSGKNDLDLYQEGEYRMYIRKQAGVYEDPLEIMFDFPEDVNLFGIPDFSLTSEGYNGYNTTLIKDKYFLIYW